MATVMLWCRRKDTWPATAAASSSDPSPVSYTHLDVYKRHWRGRCRRQRW
ncbi:hypothetical protein [Arthrobacter sp. KBS0703]|nr:hypothetical protein [Arthrobacter sp. KBS0703]